MSWLTLVVVCGLLAFVSAGGGGGGYKGGGYKGGGYKGGDAGGDYGEAPAPATAAPTPAATPAPATAAPTPAATTEAAEQRCITDAGGICTASCTIGTFTVEDTSYSCEGNGVSSVCCLTA